MAAFVGRETELVVLDRGLGSLAAGRGNLFLLCGEPGIGKTRLADELCARAKARGAAIAWGGAWDGGGAPAYWPWREVVRAIRSLVPAPDDHLRRDLGPIWELTDQREERDPEVVRFLRFDALRAVLETAALRAPLVVVLDDLHAADRASLSALHFVARSLRSLPLLIVGTHREVKDPELAELFARIAREGTTLRLSPFSLAEVEALMAKLDPVPPALVEEVLRATGGNPLFIDETLRLVRAGGRPADIRESARAVIRDRIERLDRSVRSALEGAAVLGREGMISVLAELSSQPLHALEPQLRTAQLGGILDRTGDLFRFSHPVFREEVYDSLVPDRRRELHRRTGELLAHRRAQGHAEAEETIARHLIAALPEGDPALTAEWAIRAGEAAMRGLAFDRAAVAFEGALLALERLPADPRRIDVQLSLAESLARTGAADAARNVCIDTAFAARASGDGLRLARAALLYGSQLRIAMIDRTLIDLLEEALSLLDTDLALRARLLARLAAAEQPAPDPDLPVEKAREAIALARTVADPETLMATIYSAGSALVDYAPPGERLALAQELISLALPRGELALAQQGYVRAAVDSMELCDLGGADIAIAGHRQLGQALGHPRWRWRSALLRSMRALIEGRWQDSDDARREAADLAAQADDPNAAVTLAMHAVGALRAKEAGASSDLARSWDVVLDALAVSEMGAPATRASVLARLGDSQQAARFLASQRPNLILLRDPMVLIAFADCAVVTGEASWAQFLLPGFERHRGLAVSWGVFGLIWDGPAEQWTGALLALLSRWEEARRELADGLSLAERLSARPIAARIRADLARAHANLGDDRSASLLLDQAEHEAEALGMVHLLARIASARREIGTVAKPVQLDVVSPPTLTREGAVWSIEWRDRVVRLKHSRALEMLDHLVTHAGREVHVLDFSHGEAIDAGDSGEVLDDEAKAAYRRRIRELQDDLHEAEAWSDQGRRDRLRAELEFLEEELTRSMGLGGRARRTTGAVERARVNVTKRLKGVIKKIAEQHAELGAHFEGSIKTGIHAVYRPTSA